MRTWIITLACGTAALAGCGSDSGGDVPDAASIDAPGTPDAGPPMLTCDSTDVTAPIVWQTTPVDRAIGLAPGVSLVFHVADGCGVLASTITLRIGTATVTPVITGDPEDLRVEYDPPADFALDEIVDAELGAADEAGNAVTSRVTFRVWDDYILGFRLAAGIDATMPTTPSGWHEWYRVEMAGGGGQRMVAKMDVTFGTLWPPGVKFVTARLHGCVMPIPDPRTVQAYRLNAAFDSGTTTWTQRSAGNPWATAGADAIPQDREASPFATLAFVPSPTNWPQADSGDITPIVQAWYDDPDANYGMVLVGAPGGVDFLAFGNCPPWVLGFLGRPLP